MSRLRGSNSNGRPTLAFLGEHTFQLVDQPVGFAVITLDHGAQECITFDGFRAKRMTMFLLRTRRPARFGRWIDRMLAPEPDRFGEVRGREESADVLDAELEEIGERAPETDGNPVSDWLFDSHTRVGE